MEKEESMPKGCYIFIPEKKVYFNDHEPGLAKKDWNQNSRKICRVVNQGKRIFFVGIGKYRNINNYKALLTSINVVLTLHFAEIFI